MTKEANAPPFFGSLLTSLSSSYTFFVSVGIISYMHVQTDMGGALQNLRMGGCDCMLTPGHKCNMGPCGITKNHIHKPEIEEPQTLDNLSHRANSQSISSIKYPTFD